MRSEGTSTIERMSQSQAPDTRREERVADPGSPPSSLTITVRMDLSRKYRRRKKDVAASASGPGPPPPRPQDAPGRHALPILPPPITRTLAMAIRYDAMIATGEIQDYAAVSRIARISRGRVTQVMGLLNLAPDIQEQILELPGHCSISEHAVRPVCKTLDWGDQRRMWQALRRPDPAT